MYGMHAFIRVLSFCFTMQSLVTQKKIFSIFLIVALEDGMMGAYGLARQPTSMNQQETM